MVEAHTEVYTPEQVVYKAELEVHILGMVEVHTEAHTPEQAVHTPEQADQAELVPPKTSPVEEN